MNSDSANFNGIALKRAERGRRVQRSVTPCRRARNRGFPSFAGGHPDNSAMATPISSRPGWRRAPADPRFRDRAALLPLIGELLLDETEDLTNWL
jgi:hypothetical protein